jgi:hypothetical protein
MDFQGQFSARPKKKKVCKLNVLEQVTHFNCVVCHTGFRKKKDFNGK